MYLSPQYFLVKIFFLDNIKADNLGDDKVEKLAESSKESISEQVMKEDR